MGNPSLQALADPQPNVTGLEMGEVVSGLSFSPVIQVTGLSKRFKADGPEILKDIHFDIPKGQSVALVGANGCGKSTLLRCCLGLIPISSGSVHLLGEDLNRARGRDLRRIRSRAGIVFQKHNLVPQLTVLSNVLHGAIARKSGPRAWFQSFSSEQHRRQAMDCLDQVGLAHLAARRAGQLSGGQSQRVAIARALMQQSDILFADEPAASLDPTAGRAVMDLFKRLQMDRNLTIVFVSHNVEHTLGYADRLIGMKAGQMVLDRESAHCRVAELEPLYG